jgi:hypothetical protein
VNRLACATLVDTPRPERSGHRNSTDRLDVPVRRPVTATRALLEATLGIEPRYRALQALA